MLLLLLLLLLLMLVKDRSLPSDVPPSSSSCRITEMLQQLNAEMNRAKMNSVRCPTRL